MLSARKIVIVIRRQKLGCGLALFLLFTTYYQVTYYYYLLPTTTTYDESPTLDLYGGVLWSGELQGSIIHEAVPTACVSLPRAEGLGPGLGL